MNGQTESRYTVWHFIGCGCTVLVLLALIVVGGFIWFGKQMVDGMKAGFEDPEVRAARTREILGYQELPAGYHPGFTISVPFVMEMASLGDRELPDAEEVGEEKLEEEFEKGIGGAFFDRRGFLFMKVRTFGDDPPEEAEFQGEMDLDIQIQRKLDEGMVEAGGAEVRYMSHFGYGTSDDGRVPTISTELRIGCLENPYLRMGVWFTPAPDETPEGEIPPELLEGTAADPEALKAFLDQFDLCR